jgi:hypothetical protein
MKKSEIKIGGVYTNGKGRVRQVLDRTYDGKYAFYDRQIEKDCVYYVILKDGTKENKYCGATGISSSRSFASWAKSQVQEAHNDI